MLGKIPFLQIVEHSVVCSPAKNITNDLKPNWWKNDCVDVNLFVDFSCLLKGCVHLQSTGWRWWGSFACGMKSCLLFLTWCFWSGFFFCTSVLELLLQLFIFIFIAPLATLQYNIKFHRMLISTCPNLPRSYAVGKILILFCFFLSGYQTVQANYLCLTN